MWDSFTSSKDEPIFVMRGVPVDLTMLLIMVHAGAFVVTALMLAFGLGGMLDAMAFNPAGFLHGQVWQIATYPFVKATSGGGLSLFFVLELFGLWWFGRPVEQYLGRKVFLNFYLWVWVSVPLLLTLLSFAGAQSLLFGSSDLSWAVFVAFACVYPGVRLILNLEARWLLLGGLGLYSLLMLASHAWVALLCLWWVTAFGWIMMRHAGVTASLLPESVASWIPSGKPRFRVVRPPKNPPAPPQKPPQRPTDTESLQDEMDGLLDKIAAKGISALTTAERARLENLRVALLERDRATGGRKR